MLSLIIAAVTIAIVVYLLVKGYYPQAALFIGGLILLTCTWVSAWARCFPLRQPLTSAGLMSSRSSVKVSRPESGGSA